MEHEMKHVLSEQDNHGFEGLKHAVAEMMKRISAALPELKEPIKMVIAGGVAVNFYTGSRITMDVDASFSRRVILPEDLIVPYEGPDGKLLSVHLDRSYNPTFALMHEDYEDDALKVAGSEFDDQKIDLRVLSPVDLAVSKIARLEGPDREDIAALAKLNLIYPKAVAERAKDALGCYVGNMDRLQANLREALKIVETVQRDTQKEARRGKSHER